jgi:hypothetical protein
VLEVARLVAAISAKALLPRCRLEEGLSCFADEEKSA